MKKFLIYSILTILLLTPINYMSEVWGMMSKSQIDNEKVEEAIARMIAEHEANPTAHTGENQSLQAHRQSEIIDHFAGSIVADKIRSGEITSDHITTNELVGKDIRTASNVGAGVDGIKLTPSSLEMWQSGARQVNIPVTGEAEFAGKLRAKELQFLRSFFYTSFDNLSRWLQAGTGTATVSLSPLEIRSGTSTNNIRSLYGADQSGEHINTNLKDVNIETTIKALNTTLVEYVFGINMVAGEPSNDYLPNGIAFEIKNNKVYAVKYRDNGTRDAVEIEATTPVGYHSYRIEVKKMEAIRYYIDGILKHTYTTDLPEVIPSYIFGYSVKTLTNAARFLYIANLSIEMPFD